jgi:anti-sigma regulatory factor (Ser/Thr protein kinase)
MELSLALTLPRDEQTVPVARHIVRNAMEQVGVEETCVYDVELALSEACTNVLVHSGPGDERGRGLGLMQAMVDRVDFTSRSEKGTIVTLEKVLTYRDEALLVGRRKEV